MDAVDRMVEQARVAIEDYLRTRPQSADTAEGIARWWVYPATGESDLNIVLAALELLEQGGAIERRQVGGRTLYRAGPALFG